MWIALGVVVLVVIGVLVLRAGGNKAKPKLPVFPPGSELGRWKIGYHPKIQAVSLKLDMPESERARFVVFHVHHTLFYLGNGSPQLDESGPLRQGLREVMASPASASWRVVTPEEGGTYDFSLDGTLSEAAITLPGVIGPTEQGVKRKEGCCAIVADALTRGGGGSEAVRRAVTRLLDWHDQYGPINFGKSFFSRAAAAYQGVDPTP
jgi:hypothetical protein